MSSRQLILLSGHPGAGTSAIARAVAASQRQAAVLVRSQPGGTGMATGAVRSLVEQVHPFAADALAAGPLMATADALLEVDAALESGTVVWDAGPIDRLLTDLAVLDALPVLVGQASGAITSLIAGQLLPSTSLRQMRSLLDSLAAAMRRVGAPATRMVVVERPDDGCLDRVASARARLELLSVALDHVVLNRVARTKDGASKGAARRHRGLAEAIAASGPPVCRIPQLRDAQFERKAAKRLRVLASSSQPRPEPPVLEERGSGYAYRIPLRIAAVDGLRVGVLGQALVVEVRGLRRLLPLPAVLARCSIEGAGVVGGELIVRFDPDPRLWRQAS